MTFHHNAKNNVFHISIDITAFFRYIGSPEGPETDIVASSDSVKHRRSQGERGHVPPPNF